MWVVLFVIAEFTGVCYDLCQGLLLHIIFCASLVLCLGFFAMIHGVLHIIQIPTKMYTCEVV
jgi:hypothetical protein